MKLEYKYPPNYDLLCKHFPIKGKRGVVFTYGDTLYVPDKGEITEDLYAHEETHTKQQSEIGIEEWWEKYIENVEFRLSQEVEAYRNQYQYAIENYNRPQRRRLLQHISRDLASPMYGSLVSKEEAKSLITDK